MRSLVVGALLLLAVPASAQRVLLIPDEDGPGSASLAGALQAGGMQVTTAFRPSYQYDGASPAPNGFDVIVLLAGGPGPNSANVDMPFAGQSAIANFVGAGGGLVNTEWSAFQVSFGRWQTLKPLVLLGRTSGTTGFIDYNVTQAFRNHPLWVGLPASFSFATATNVGVVIPQPGVVRVATSVQAGDAVAIRDRIGVGRIVQLSTAGNFTPQTWTDPNLRALMVNACRWASASRVNQAPVANIGGPYAVDEGGAVALAATCTDPNGDMVTLSWDLNDDNVFGDAVGAMTSFSAVGVDGPSMRTVRVRCTDTGGLSDTRSATVTVRNVAPVFTTMPPTTATEGMLYSYKATVSDPHPNDNPACALVAGPMGLSVTPSCAVNWLPTYDQARAGTANVDVSVTDKDGGASNQKWTITVSWLDADMDGLPDTWEMMHFGNLAQAPAGDPDKDGRPNLKEFQDSTNPTMYDGPTAPTVMSPIADARVKTANPDLVVKNATQAKNDPLTYEFQVYADAQLTNLLDVTLGVPEGMGTTRYTVKNALPENKHLYWRCRALDPYVAGPWSMVATFFVDAVRQGPTAPVLSMPANGAKVKALHPTLVVTNAKSPDELALTYEFEVYRDANLTMRADAKAGVPEGMGGSTSYFVAPELMAYAHYYWRARAADSGGLTGPWSQTGTFQIFPTNPAPSPPVIEFPTNGARVAARSPTIRFGGSVDLNMEPITYQCDVDRGNTFDSPAKQSVMGIRGDMMNRATWTPPMPLDENGRYCVRCRARDPSGSSTWTHACFLIDVRNDPPSVPTLSNPSADGMAAGAVVVFTWVNSIDPEGDSIRYEVEVYRDAALTDRATDGTAGDGPVGLTLSGFSPGPYWWRARAVDTLGAASEFAAPNAFAVTAFAPNPGGAAGCGCHLGGRAAPPPLALVALSLALVAALRRRWR